jgi:CHAD domain-containing protein
MANDISSSGSQKKQRSGLAHFMTKVLKDVKRADPDLQEEPVHDLRTALRRCRTMAHALSAFDPEKSFKKMRKSSGKLFRSLGELRDVQVMMEWVKKIASPADPLAVMVCQELGKKEAVAGFQAAQALKRFDKVQWRKWSRVLPKEMRRIPLGGMVFEHLALTRWTEAKDTHRKALRNPSSKNLHEMRIALKHFRYAVENFLPRRSGAWAADLKEVQDLLGDIHDLDVLREEVEAVAKKANVTGIGVWRTSIEQERSKRLTEFWSRTRGRKSLFKKWRDDLPSGERLEEAALESLFCWASFRDPDIQHSKHVTGLALKIWQGLGTANIQPVWGGPLEATYYFAKANEGGSDSEARRAQRVLAAAGMLHEVGRVKKDAGHHKRAFRMIKKLDPPMTWSKGELVWTGLVARYHRGAEPHQGHKEFSSLVPAEQNAVRWLSATLRLADALDAEHDGRVSNAVVERSGRVVMIRAEGYMHDAESAGALGEKKHLLETLCGCPIIVQPARAALKVMAASAS